MNETIKTLPLLPLRGTNAFPNVLLSFEVERPASVAALNAALGEDRELFLVTQSDITAVMPRASDLYGVGTICTVRQLLRIPGTSTVKVMVEGNYRARILSINENAPYYTAEVERMEDLPGKISAPRREALLRSLADSGQIGGKASP